MKKIFFLLMTLCWLTAINAQWIEQNSGTTENLNDVFCITADTVVVVGDNGTILRTTNGGTLWNPVTNPASVNLHRVEFADTQTGYAVGDNGTVLKSTDAGQTWQSLNTGTNENLLALSCVAVDTLYVGGTNGLMLKSVDSGVSWTTENTGISYTIQDIQMINNTTGYATACNMTNQICDNFLFLTKNTNDTQWTFHNGGGSDLIFINQTTGFILFEGYILKTVDSGNSFNSIQNLFGGNKNGIFTLDGNTIWTVGKVLVIGADDDSFISVANLDDDGLLLNQDNLFFSYYDNLNEITFKNQIGYVVGFNGVILKNLTGINTARIKTTEFKIFSISPNPAKNQVFINLKDSKIQYPVQYRIVDLEGKELTPFTAIQTGKPIDVSRLAKGIYLIQVQNQGQIYTQKLLIQK